MSAQPATAIAPGKRRGRFSRSAWLLIGLAAVLIGGTVLVQILTPSDQGAGLPMGSSLSAAPDGTLALFRWLESENYRVTRVREYPFDRLGLDALVIVAPRAVDFTDDDATDAMSFVQAGGTLIFVSDGFDATRPLQRSLGLDFTHPKNAVAAAAATPIGLTLARPPVKTVAVKSGSVVQPSLQNDAHFLPRATSTNGTTVATLTRGYGRIQIITGAYPVTNAGLPEGDNLALVQNLLAGLPPGARIGFDEYHHGLGSGTQIADLALRSPWGWTIIYLALLLLTALVLNGRRFGRPLPPPPAPAPAPVEYARALGDRWRERKQFAFAQDHLADDLKRALGHTFSLDPTAEDQTFVAALYAVRPDLAQQCQTLIAALREPITHESELTALAAHVQDLRTRLMESVTLRV